MLTKPVERFHVPVLASDLGGCQSPCEQLDHRWLTAKLTANRSDLRRSAGMSADEHEPSTCRDGRQRMALDRRGKVSSPVTPAPGPASGPQTIRNAR